MSVEEFQFPAVRITEIVKVDGRLEQAALDGGVCDFCSDMRIEWDYDCETFALPEIEFGSVNGWAACGRCSGLIEAGDREGLVARAAASPEVARPESELRLIQDGFYSHRYGERRPAE